MLIRKRFILTFLFLLAGCLGNKGELQFEAKRIPVQPVQGQKDESFERLKAQVLKPHCIKCHAKLDSFEGLSQTGWIVPGSPEESRLFLSVESGSMPKRAPALGTDKLEIIRLYITSLLTDNIEGSD